jgi:hypothetical protein
VRDTDTQFLAHGIGGQQDLPIPAHYAYIGAAVALIVSFAVLAFAWRTPRFRGDASGRPLWPWLARIIDSPVTHAVVVTLALLFTAWVSMAAVFGQNTLVNPTFRAVYVALWVGLVPMGVIFGSVYRLCNPLRWLHRGICRAAGIDPAQGLRPYPAGLGLWPAALFVLAFVWLELVNPATSASLPAVRLWFAMVGALTMVGAAVYGDTWFARADPFEVYSSLAARLSPFGRRAQDGVLVLRNPLENLDGMTALPGLVAVVSVLFGSIGFDSFKESPRWLAWAQQYSDHSTVLNTAALVAFSFVVFATFTLASIATGGLGGISRSSLPNLLAHSVVPIVIGYVVAHYLSFFVAEGIALIQELGDPLSRGWSLTSWADGIDKYAIYNHPTTLAVIKVVSVITGHVLGVVAAHDRAVRLLPRRNALVGQLPMLVVMVCYTLTGLWLLLSY